MQELIYYYYFFLAFPKWAIGKDLKNGFVQLPGRELFPKMGNWERLEKRFYAASRKGVWEQGWS